MSAITPINLTRAVRLDDFDYSLPADRIAQHPSAGRDEARLLVHHRAAALTEHHVFHELPALLPAGALLVVNDTRVVPARLRGRKPTGGAVELLLLDAAPAPDGLLRCLLRSAKPLRPGTRVELCDAAGAASTVAAVVESRDGAEARVRLLGADVTWVLARLGEIPLPPYIERTGPPGPDDAERYQTVYAAHAGAVAAPTAGLHFTRELLALLAARGHEVCRLTLHVGPGTFLPVRKDDPSEHVMHPERYSIPPATAAALAEARRRGRMVVAVGTTCVRALESAVAPLPEGAPVPAVAEGDTRLFIYPGFRFRVVDALITNFHLPRSTLLMLVAALCGRERLLALYREAIGRGYRFYSYGDAMLVLP
jgi:S-adenosylmethionine:tRNA ribosyltransferase-isomerase